MAIKKLQNNYTTPEQSKRLLELGVPADSANCYYDSWKRVQWRQQADLHNDFFESYPHYIPCWTVGRFIELLVTCAIDKDYVEEIIKGTACYAAAVETYVNVITYLYKKKELDFSKLEE